MWCTSGRRLFAAELRATGDVRDDLDARTLVDIVWSMNSAEFWTLLAHERGWTAQRLSDFIARPGSASCYGRPPMTDSESVPPRSPPT